MRFGKQIALGTLSFVVTILGLNVGVKDTSAINTQQTPQRAAGTLEQSRATLASAACIPQNDEDEIFFLSCGGVF